MCKKWTFNGKTAMDKGYRLIDLPTYPSKMKK